MYTGPKLTDDNLVFGYDTGYPISDNDTATRFSPGKPCSNLWVTSSQLLNHTDVTVGDASIVKEDFGDGKIGVKMVQVGTSNIVSFTLSNPSVVSGGTYSWSSFVHSTSAGTKVKSQVTVYVNGTRHWLTNSNTWQTSVVECNHLFAPTVANEWHRVVNQFTMPSGTLTSFSIGGWYRATSNFTFKVANCQFELSAMATPFTTSSRSDTASLIDLKKTRDINVSNVSFDSDGQPEFDGTDDFIPVNNLLASQAIGAATQLTISMWLNPDTHSDDMPFSTGQSGNDRIYYWTTNGVNTWRVNGYTSTTGHGTLPAIGNWYNTVLVIDGLSIRVYLNGVEDYTASYTAFTTEHYATFGRHGASSSYYYNGKIAVARIHDKAMSAEEIKSNFNAYKNRFNL